MPANSALQVTSLNFDTIKQGLKSYISARPEFLDYNFEGSVINLLLDVLAYNTYQNAYYTSMVGNEMFLDSALMRNSVVSRSKMLGYTPRSARSATTTLAVVVSPGDAPESVTITKGTTFATTIDGQSYNFITPENYVFTANDAYSGTITVAEGRSVTHRFTVSTANPSRYIIPNGNIDTTSLTVQVQGSAADSTVETYALATDFTQVLANSAIYFLQETDDAKYEVYFGDGVIGKQPNNNNIVVLSYRVCNGSDGNDVSSMTNPSTLGGYSIFTATVNAPTTSGGNTESIDSIKYNAPKNFETQNRAVLARDYERIILANNADIQSVSVWGGEDNTPAIYGKVYVSVKPSTGTVISQARKDEIKSQLKRYNVLSIDPEFVNASILYIRPRITVRFDPTQTILSAGDIQTKVLNNVIAYETTFMSTFEQSKRKFRFSNFIKQLHNTDPSVQSVLVAIEMEKRFAPSITASSTYRIAFNNKIQSPSSPGHITHSGGHSIRSSSFSYRGRNAYFDDDGEGVLRIYYTSGNDIIYLNETAGTINYDTGLVTIEDFLPTGFAGSELSIYADPDIIDRAHATQDIAAIRNQILLLAGAKVTVVNDNNDLVVATSVEATTGGVTTTTVESGINPVVY